MPARLAKVLFVYILENRPLITPLWVLSIPISLVEMIHAGSKKFWAHAGSVPPVESICAQTAF